MGIICAFQVTNSLLLLILIPLLTEVNYLMNKCEKKQLQRDCYICKFDVK